MPGSTRVRACRHTGSAAPPLDKPWLAPAPPGPLSPPSTHTSTHAYASAAPAKARRTRAGGHAQTPTRMQRTVLEASLVACSAAAAVVANRLSHAGGGATPSSAANTSQKVLAQVRGEHMQGMVVVWGGEKRKGGCGVGGSRPGQGPGLRVLRIPVRDLRRARDPGPWNIVAPPATIACPQHAPPTPALPPHQQLRDRRSYEPPGHS